MTTGRINQVGNQATEIDAKETSTQRLEYENLSGFAIGLGGRISQTKLAMQRQHKWHQSASHCCTKNH
jgi:hypothetical protein